MAQKPIKLPGKLMETIELRERVGARIRIKGRLEKYALKNGTLFWELKSCNNRSNVTWITPMNDLSSDLAAKKALRHLVNMVKLIPPDRL
jgi:hypothetical protein